MVIPEQRDLNAAFRLPEQPQYGLGIGGALNSVWWICRPGGKLLPGHWFSADLWTRHIKVGRDKCPSRGLPVAEFLWAKK